MNLIDQIHGGYVFERRVRVLSEELAPLIPQNAQVLDVGCGDGVLSKLIMEKRPDVRISGIHIITVTAFWLGPSLVSWTGSGMPATASFCHITIGRNGSGRRLFPRSN